MTDEKCERCDRAMKALDNSLVFNRQLLDERNRYKAALEEIKAILSPPCDDNGCGGCGHEMADAAGIVQKALDGSEIKTPLIAPDASKENGPKL